MTFKLAHAVRIKCYNNSSSRFEYPTMYVHGSHSVTNEEFSLNKKQEEFASSALLHCTRYIMIVQIDTALEMCIENRFEHIDNQVKSTAWIARLIRNAFSHDPFNPKWLIDRKCRNNTYEIENIIKMPMDLSVQVANIVMPGIFLRESCLTVNIVESKQVSRQELFFKAHELLWLSGIG